jgi:ABC-type dipeptide/oligopeptide/nickel transport system permease component
MITISRWILSTTIVIWLAATLAFIGLRIIPGNAIETQLRQSGADAVAIEERLKSMGLDLPLPVQYGKYLIDLLHGNMGHSLITGQPVSEMIGEQLSPTLALAVPAWILSIILGFSFGFLGGTDANHWHKQIAQTMTTIILSTPIYWSSTLLIVIGGTLMSPSSGLPNWLLPAILLGAHTSGAIARMVQTNIQTISQSDYVRTARAKGLPEKMIIWRHILPIALIPAIPITGLQLGFLLGGTVVTESLFARPGLGQLLLNSTLQQDYPVVQGLVILSAGVYALLTGAATVASEWLDPRIRA